MRKHHLEQIQNDLSLFLNYFTTSLFSSVVETGVGEFSLPKNSKVHFTRKYKKVFVIFFVLQLVVPGCECEDLFRFSTFQIGIRSSSKAYPPKNSFIYENDIGLEKRDIVKNHSPLLKKSTVMKNQ